jgi:hypothetical protein
MPGAEKDLRFGLPFTVMLTKVSIHVCANRSSQNPWMPTFVGMTTPCPRAPNLSDQNRRAE